MGKRIPNINDLKQVYSDKRTNAHNLDWVLRLRQQAQSVDSSFEEGKSNGSKFKKGKTIPIPFKVCLKGEESPKEKHSPQDITYKGN